LEANQLTYLYELDETKKFLNLKIIRDSVIKLPKLTKAKSVYDFLEKTIDLEIDLSLSSTKTDNRVTQLSLKYQLLFNHLKVFFKNI